MRDEMRALRAEVERLRAEVEQPKSTAAALRARRASGSGNWRGAKCSVSDGVKLCQLILPNDRRAASRDGSGAGRALRQRSRLRRSPSLLQIGRG